MARIAIVNNFFPPRPSGSAHLSQNLAAHLGKRGHDVIVITASYGDAPVEEIVDGYRVVRLRSRTLPKMKIAFNYDINFAASPRNVRRLFGILDEFHPDVIHQNGQFFDLTFASSLYVWRRRVPAVLSVHTRLESPNRLHNLILRLGDMTLVRLFIALSRPHFIVMDRLMDAYIRTRYRAKASRLVAIPVGVDPGRFVSADRRSVRADLGIGERPMILSIGHVIPIRDRVTLVAAMPRLLEEWPDAVLVVVGGIFEDRFQHLASELGVSDHVIATGPVPKEVIPDYVAAADIETHDLEGYGLGTASLEAMAAGVPTIAAVRADNFLDVRLESWKNIVLVEPGDAAGLAEAMIRLLADPELARGIAEAQRRLIAERFSLSVVANAYERVFLDLA